MQYDPAFRLPFSLTQIAAELEGTKQKGGAVEGLANTARRYADECKRRDRGGELRMRAFNVLLKASSTPIRTPPVEVVSGVAREQANFSIYTRRCCLQLARSLKPSQERRWRSPMTPAITWTGSL
jgi:hypothetical protein